MENKKIYEVTQDLRYIPTMQENDLYYDQYYCPIGSRGKIIIHEIGDPRRDEDIAHLFNLIPYCTANTGITTHKMHEYPNITINTPWIDITDKMRKAYFKPMYEAFGELIKSMTFEDFTNTAFTKKLQNLLRENSESATTFIIIAESENLMPLDVFLREYKGKYYIGNTFAVDI